MFSFGGYKKTPLLSQVVCSTNLKALILLQYIRGFLISIIYNTVLSYIVLKILRSVKISLKDVAIKKRYLYLCIIVFIILNHYHDLQ